MTWMRMNSSSWKTHIVPQGLVEAIQEDLLARHPDEPLPVWVSVSEAYLDMPGMILADRSHHDFSVDGLKLTIPIMDVADFLRELRLAKPRSASKYYKIHGFMVCIVLNEEQRNLLLAQMQTCFSKYINQAAIESEKFEAAIDAVNKDQVRVIHFPKKGRGKA